MQLTMARTPSLRPILYLALVALLIAALAAAALLVGSQKRVPEPFGLARNGVVVFEQDGDLLIADGLDGPTRTLVGGPETDYFPVFSRQGDRLAFVRDVEDGIQLMSVRPDGSDAKVLGSFPGELERVTWSPDGSALLMTFTETGIPDSGWPSSTPMGPDPASSLSAGSRTMPGGVRTAATWCSVAGSTTASRGRSSPMPTARTCAELPIEPRIWSTSRA